MQVRDRVLGILSHRLLIFNGLISFSTTDYTDEHRWGILDAGCSILDAGWGIKVSGVRFRVSGGRCTVSLFFLTEPLRHGEFYFFFLKLMPVIREVECFRAVFPVFLVIYKDVTAQRGEMWYIAPVPFEE